MAFNIMALNAAEKDTMEARREQVAALRLRGKSSRAIASVLGVSHVTVCADLKVIETRWREHAVSDIAEHKAHQLAEYAQVKAAAWRADDLDAVLKALAQEAKLLGLDAAEKRDLTSAGEPIRFVEVA